MCDRRRFPYLLLIVSLTAVCASGCGGTVSGEDWHTTWGDPFRIIAGMSLLLMTAYSMLSFQTRQSTSHTILITPGVVAPQIASPPRRGHYAILASVFISIAVYGSWVPFRTQTLSLTRAWQFVMSAPLLEFNYSDRSDWGTNVLLFIPIGFCCLAAFCADRSERKSLVIGLPLVIIGCFVLSFLIEFGQLWLPGRVFSQNDIAAQTIGTLIGISLWSFAGRAITDWLRAYTGDAAPKRQIDWLLQAYLIGLFVYSVVPLNLTIHPEELYAKFRDGRVILVPFSGQPWSFSVLGGYIADALICAPVGALAASCWTPSDRPLRSMTESVFIGTLIVAVIEFCQLLVQSRFSDMTDVVTGMCGVVLGAWVVRCFGQPPVNAIKQPRGLRRGHYAMIAGIYALFLIAYFWRPFEIIDDAQLIRRRFAGIIGIPGASLHSVSEFRALTEILRKSLLFFPLGALLTIVLQPQSAESRFSWFRFLFCVSLAFGVGMIIELGQVLIIEHTPDSSDALLCSLGAAVGFLITQRVLRYGNFHFGAG